MQEIEGVYVANVTPFGDDGTLAVDEEAYLEHVAWLAEMGVRGVVPFGTNGEGSGASRTLGETMPTLSPFSRAAKACSSARRTTCGES